MIKFFMVDVESVTSNVPRSNFQETELEILADMILESGGILKPLVLKKIGFEQYEVVDGHFEYYSAVRAKEKNPSEGDMIGALIISSEEEDIVLKQVASLKEINTPITVDSANVKPSADNIDSKSSSLNNELRLMERQLNDLKSELAQERMERQNLHDTMKSLESQITKRITPLESFNALNLLDLTFRLRTAGFSDNKAAQIAESVDKERKKKTFESLKEVVERVKIQNSKKPQKGISSDKMLDIVDTWSKLLFL